MDLAKEIISYPLDSELKIFIGCIMGEALVIGSLTGFAGGCGIAVWVLVYPRLKRLLKKLTIVPNLLNKILSGFITAVLCIVAAVKSGYLMVYFLNLLLN